MGVRTVPRIPLVASWLKNSQSERSEHSERSERGKSI